MVKEVLPMMVDLFQSHPQPPPEPFKIPNFKSSNIFENDLWFLYISRLTSLFAPYASKSHNFSIEKMTLCLHYHSPSLPWLWMCSSSNGDRSSIQCNSFDQPMLIFCKIIAIIHRQLFRLLRKCLHYNLILISYSQQKIVSAWRVASLRIKLRIQKNR